VKTLINFLNTEFLEDDRAIFRVGVFRSLAFHCKILSMRDILTERIRKYMILERLTLR
jgi:hypothetical protein